MTIPLVVLALLMGGLISVYLPMISQTANILKSAPLANVPFFGIAFVSSILISLMSGSKTDNFSTIPSLPLWLLSAGVLSAFMVLGSSYLVPKIGISAFFVLVVSGQIITGMIFSSFGLLGAPISPLSLGKLIGLVMVIFGAYLVTYK